MDRQDLVSHLEHLEEFCRQAQYLLHKKPEGAFGVVLASRLEFKNSLNLLCRYKKTPPPTRVRDTGGTCKGAKPNGKACRGFAVSGSVFCRHHQGQEQGWTGVEQLLSGLPPLTAPNDI